MAKKDKPRRQCRHCPWKVTTDPYDIPDGYCPTKHAKLSNTIAVPGDVTVAVNRQPLVMMACHETGKGAELPCVGWLEHQIGEGNNIALRIAVMRGHVDGNVETVGEQHTCLEDTLPKGPPPKRRRRGRKGKGRDGGS